jgi:hypothetical protein
MYILQYKPIPDCFIALTQNGQLIKYIITPDEITAVNTFDTGMEYMRNFTFAKDGHILLPTGNDQLFIIDPHTFEVVETKKEVGFFAITYLPVKNVYLADSQDNPSLMVLNENFEVIGTANTDFIISLKTNALETLVAVHCYDQEPGYTLYEFNDSYELQMIDEFSRASGFLFINDTDFASSNYSHLEFCNHYETGQYEILWEVYFPSGLQDTPMVQVNPELIIVAKNKHLFFVDIPGKKISATKKVHEKVIDGLFIDDEKKFLIITAKNDIKTISLK